jgi:Amt family ammonium transporter
MLKPRKRISTSMIALGALVAVIGLSVPLFAQATDTAPVVTAATATAPAAAPKPDTGSVAWILTSALLVCFMIPGLAMFYGGMVRAKNVLNTMLACIAPIGLIGVLWLAVGYATAFCVVPAEAGKDAPAPSFFHFDSNLIFLKGTGMIGTAENYGAQLTSGDTVGAAPTGVPELAFFAFQGMFAIITPAMIFGAVAERVRFGPLMLFYAIWALVVYNPVAHWVWNPAGWLFQKGVMDFAGGTVVHVLAGVSGLALCLVVGKRRGYDGKTPIAPHSVGMTLLGAAFLMVGWFGFNAGSAIGIPGAELPVAGQVAVLAFVTTFVAAATAGLAWMCMEWVITKKPTALGFASGLVAGLVAITPCAGHVTPASACLIGALGGIVCFFGCRIKYLLGFDDSLDAFGVHGIGGFLGALLVGIFAIRPAPGGGEQFMKQLIGASSAAVYCFVLTFIIGFIIHKTIGFRVKPEVEDEGIDINVHGEEGYKFTG